MLLEGNRPGLGLVFALAFASTPFVAGLILPIASIGAIGNPLPPSARLLIPGGARSLRADCDAYVNARSGPASDNSSQSVWADDVDAGYEVASLIFDTILVACREHKKQDVISVHLWLPKVKDVSMINDLAKVIRDNSIRLGGWTAQVEAWPRAPATGISLLCDPTIEGTVQYSPPNDTCKSIGDAVSATEAWVDNTLGQLGLCPYTASLQRAAIGLESIGVQEGPVAVRHASSSVAGDAGGRDDSVSSLSCTDAAVLAASFWKGVMDLSSKPEDEIATFLIVAPSNYDDNFAEFVFSCDNLLERSAKVVRADEVIGKAWFHPNYDSDIVGHDTILPGHALPAKMVREFVDNYFGDGNESQQQPQQKPQLDIAAIAKANDAVRHTPHATVNLLRRSQLRASKDAEAAAGAQKPNLVYARNVVRITASDMSDLI